MDERKKGKNTFSLYTLPNFLQPLSPSSLKKYCYDYKHKKKKTDKREA